MADLDWSLIRTFLAVVDHGSLSAAARALGLSQPTLGRHVRALEHTLGADLFRRVPNGLEPTEAGAALVASARAMAEAAARLSLAAEGGGAALKGTVRITASNIVSHHLLPPILARLRADAPEIQIELVPTDGSENLLFREADIALRMYRPDQLDIVARRLRDLPLGFYAAKSYLDRAGRPASYAEALERDFVGFDRDDSAIRILRAQGVQAGREFFPVRCDHQPTYWELVRAGCGIGAMQRVIADADPLLERVAALDAIRLEPLQLWLAAPGALRTSPRIRRVWDALAEAFAPS
ncbi:LysR family transcriptional regulator [Rhodobacterales bacterium HKCCE2091]|nr:LysR family transcriptional regulator [Rhodobacterales bacterium HKCCE2091]